MSLAFCFSVYNVAQLFILHSRDSNMQYFWSYSVIKNSFTFQRSIQAFPGGNVNGLSWSRTSNVFFGFVIGGRIICKTEKLKEASCWLRILIVHKWLNRILVFYHGHFFSPALLDFPDSRDKEVLEISFWIILIVHIFLMLFGRGFILGVWIELDEYCNMIQQWKIVTSLVTSIHCVPFAFPGSIYIVQ